MGNEVVRVHGVTRISVPKLGVLHLLRVTGMGYILYRPSATRILRNCLLLVTYLRHMYVAIYVYSCYK